MQRFGEKLRTLRQRHGITQMRLAAEFGFSTNTYIGLIEHGKKQPSLTFVIRIADLFDVTIDSVTTRSYRVTTTRVDALDGNVR